MFVECLCGRHTRKKEMSFLYASALSTNGPLLTSKFTACASHLSSGCRERGRQSSRDVSAAVVSWRSWAVAEGRNCRKDPRHEPAWHTAWWDSLASLQASYSGWRCRSAVCP